MVQQSPSPLPNFITLPDTGSPSLSSILATLETDESSQGDLFQEAASRPLLGTEEFQSQELDTNGLVEHNAETVSLTSILAAMETEQAVKNGPAEQTL